MQAEDKIKHDWMERVDRDATVIDWSLPVR